jgi:hypothetical protein
VAQVLRRGLQYGQLYVDTALPKEVEHCSLTTLRKELVEILTQAVRHGRYVTYKLGEVAVSKTLPKKLALIDKLRRSLVTT